WIRRIFSAELVITGLTVLALSVVFVFLEGSAGVSAAQSAITFERFLHNASHYYLFLLSGSAASILSIPGALRLWRLDPSLLLAVLYVIVVWPLAHSPFYFYDARYMLPPLFFVFFLIALGPLEVWRWTRLPTRLTNLARAYTVVSVAGM